MMRFQWALKPSESLAMPWRSTSPKVGGKGGGFEYVEGHA